MSKLALCLLFVACYDGRRPYEGPMFEGAVALSPISVGVRHPFPDPFARDTISFNAFENAAHFPRRSPVAEITNRTYSELWVEVFCNKMEWEGYVPARTIEEFWLWDEDQSCVTNWRNTQPSVWADR